MRLIGERKACAAAVMAFFATIFLLNALAGPRPFMAMFLGLGLVYLTGFFGLVSGWFWARWYTMGTAFSGMLVGVMLWWQVGLETIVMIWIGAHLAVALALWGKGPAAAFDGRRDWRERFRMDDNAANRLGKAIVRAGASLPYLIMAGLAPRQGMGAAVLALVLGIAGVRALVRLRTWGVLALGGAAAAAIIASLDTVAPLAGHEHASLPAAGLAAVLLVAAVAPFARPLVRALATGVDRTRRSS